VKVIEACLRSPPLVPVIRHYLRHSMGGVVRPGVRLLAQVPPEGGRDSAGQTDPHNTGRNCDATRGEASLVSSASSWSHSSTGRSAEMCPATGDTRNSPLKINETFALERNPSMPRLPKVALLTEDALQADALREMLQEHLALTHITSFLELEKRSWDGQIDALFCDWHFGKNGWKEALENVRARHPDLPVIFLSRTGGEREWMEVLDAGAFDLLVPPYSAVSLLAVVEHAAASRMARQWQSETLIGGGRRA